MNDQDPDSCIHPAVVLIGTILAVTFMPMGHAASGSYGNSPNQAVIDGNQAILEQNQKILDQLAKLEQKIDAMQEDAPSVSATFCISQGRAFEIGAGYNVGVQTEGEIGVGWPVALDASMTYTAGWPVVPFVPIGPGIPLAPIPNEAGVSVGGSHGKNFDICIDLPLEMSPNDEATLVALGDAINFYTDDDFGGKGKFQRRASRLLNYADRRVPGGPDGLEDRAASFDEMDDAIESILNGGVIGDGSPVGLLKDPNIARFVNSFEGMPENVRLMIEHPEQFIQPLSQAVTDGIDNMTCQDFNVSETLRNQHAGLGELCTKLENLPPANDVIELMSGETVAELYQALNSISISNGKARISDESRNRICNTRLGRSLNFCN